MEEEIKLQVIKSAIKKLPESQEIEEHEKKENELALLRARRLQIEIDGRADYFKLRTNWSDFLQVVLWCSVMFQFVVTILVGGKVLDYLQYQWFINLVMGENFLQIIGLCYIVVKHLFPQDNGK